MDAATRLIVVGGFLGAGKTTALLRLAEHYRSEGRRVGVIANDQAEGLVDTARFAAAGIPVDEVAGGCFCCRFDDFLARADHLLAEARPEILLAEPVGSCTDLVATVIEPLARFHPDRFEVAPFSVLVDPERALAMLGGRGPVGLSEKVTWLFGLQQQEADALVVSKLDRLDAADRAELDRHLAERFPDVPRLAMSSRDGTGFEDWLALLAQPRPASPRLLADLDYAAYAEAEAELGWLNCHLELGAPAPLEVDAALADLGQALHAYLASDFEIAHGKLLLRGDRRSAAISLVGRAEPEMVQRAEEASARLDLVVNLRIEADPQRFHLSLQEQLMAWCDRQGLDVLDGGGQAFRPPPPVPTHRVTD